MSCRPRSVAPTTPRGPRIKIATDERESIEVSASLVERAAGRHASNVVTGPPLTEFGAFGEASS